MQCVYAIIRITGFFHFSSARLPVRRMKGIHPAILTTYEPFPERQPTAGHRRRKERTMNQIKELLRKHKALIAYAFFGALTTLVNIVTYGVCTWFGMSTGWANALAWVLSVLFAYLTNRRWVFESENSSRSAVMKEFASFVACRLGTGVLDQVIMVLGVDVLGPKIIPEPYAYLWSLGLKIASNVLVIILNYVFSKLIIFKKKK